MRAINRSIFFLSLAVGIFGLGGSLFAQTAALIALHQFDGTNGAYALASVVFAGDGNLYGASYEGGISNYGTVYRITTSGAYTVLTNFTGTNGPVLGAYPAATMTLGPDGGLYGTTFYGGTNNGGTVFKLTTNGVLTSLFSFGPLTGTRTLTGILGNPPATNSTGGEPDARLTFGPDGNLYGTTLYGGSNGVGTIFKITTNGALTSLFSFDYAASNTAVNATGAKPIAGMTLGPDGNLYGTTGIGGSNGVGSVFKITTNGTFTSLAACAPAGSNGTTHTNATGYEPGGELILASDGSFYGTCGEGGANGAGTIFRLTTNGTFTAVYSFSPLIASDRLNGDAYWYTNDSGAQPVGAMAFGKDGNLYGTGSNGGLGGVGTVFEFMTNGTLIPLVSFDPANSDADTNYSGSYPSTLIFGSDGNLYGTGYKGGFYDYGTVYKVILGADLNIQFLGGNAVLTWSNSAFSLQSAPAVTGSWSTIGGATNPHTNAITGPQKFFRLLMN